MKQSAGELAAGLTRLAAPRGLGADTPAERRFSWMGRVRLAVALGPIMALFGLVYVGSLLRMLLLSLGAPDFTLRHYMDLAANVHLLGVLLYTLGLAAFITGLCLLLGYPVALVMLHSSARVRRMLAVVVVIPMWISTLVRSYAWMVLLGRRGVVNEAFWSLGLTAKPLPLLYNRFAVCVGLVYVLLPFMVFPIYSVMRQVDPRLVDAARSLGATRLATQLHVFVPLTLPGMVVGCVLVFVMALAYWVTPTLLGGLDDTTFVMLIEQQINVIGNWAFAAAMSVAILAIALFTIFVFQRVLGFGAVAPGTGPASSRRSLRLVRCFAGMLGWTHALSRQLRPWKGTLALRASGPGAVRSYDPAPRIPVARAITALVVIYLLGPIAVLFPLSFSASPYMQFPPTGFSLQWYERYFGDRIWVEATLVSLRVAVATSVLGLLIGTLAALGLSRARFRFRGALVAVILSPLVVPNIVIAVALYFQLAPMGLVGSELGLVLSHLVLTTPFVVLVVMGALQSFDQSLEHAARSLGARPAAAFRWVVLPLILPAMVTAAFFAFIVSFDEVIVAVFLSGTTAATLPKQLLNATRFEFRPTIAAVSVVLIVGTVAIVLLVDLVQRWSGRGRKGLSAFLLR